MTHGLLRVRTLVRGSALLGLCMAAGPALADCPAAFDAVRTALAGGDLAAAQSAYTTQGPTCSGPDRAQLGRAIAQAMYNQAVSASPVNEEMLRQSQQYGRVWQVSATLADLALGRTDFRSAAQLYQLALMDIEEAPAEEAIPRDVVLALRRKAEEAQLLAPAYDPSPRGRNGENAGLASWSFRGSAVRARALPIEFAYGSTDFTDKGRQAADDLVRQLLNPVSPPPARIVLEGHTDPVGSDAYNMKLSLDRAQALKSYVEAALAAETRSTGRNVPVVIEAVGKGEREQFEPYDPSLYSEAQLHQLSRRVVIKRGD